MTIATVAEPSPVAPELGALLELDSIQKRFPGTLAVHLGPEKLRFAAGEIHGLVGENGAGKSTLCKVIAGIVPPTAGSMALAGAPYAPHDAADGRRRGVDIVVQEPGLVDTMSVEDNLVLGREDVYAPRVVFAPRTRRALAAAALARVPAAIDLTIPAGRLTLEDQKLVELARALSQRPDVLLVDEITASLSHRSVRPVFDLLRSFAEAGGLVIYISHHLGEIFEICQRVTVMRDGQVVTTVPTSATSEADLAALMVGRAITASSAPQAMSTASPSVLTVDGLTVDGKFTDVSFDLRPGEVLGIGGLVRCGSETLALTLFGAVPPTSGTMRLGGTPFAPSHPKTAIARGVGFVPSDRDREGLILGLSIERNIGLPRLVHRSWRAVIRPADERRQARALLDRLAVTSRGPTDVPLTLSGGNRQKVVLAKWLASEVRLVILHNPTRGVDVGGKEEIYGVIHEMQRNGVGIVLVSDDLPELIRLSDRLMIMRGGAISYRTTRAEEPSESVLIGYIL